VPLSLGGASTAYSGEIAAFGLSPLRFLRSMNREHFDKPIKINAFFDST
jgi:hypothetical protein